MTPTVFNFKFTAHASISHIGTTASIDASFHRVKWQMPDSRIILLPTITGNSWRGQLRDALASHLIEHLELGALPLSKFYLLFSGGSLDKKSTSLEDMARLRHLLPMLSLLGASVGNHIMAGRLKVGMLIPVCKETSHLFGDGTVSIYDLMQTEEYTRMDDAKDARKRNHLQDGTEDTMEASASQQMRYRIETMIAGTTLTNRVSVETGKDDELLLLGAFITSLMQWGRNPILGGKSSIGHGSVSVEAPDMDIHIHPDGMDIGGLWLDYATIYLRHLQEHRDEIIEVLS